MSSKNAPCKGCEERHTACHDHCAKYAEWRTALHEEKARYKEYKQQRREDWLRGEQHMSNVEKWRARKRHGIWSILRAMRSVPCAD